MGRTLTWMAAAAAAGMLAMGGPARADVFDDNPGAASRGAGDLNAFARASDGSVLWRRWAGDDWSDWASIGGNAGSGPAAAAYGKSVNVFIRGSDGGVYQNSLSDGKWLGWVSLGGIATSAPAALWRRGPLNYFDLAVRGTDNQIWFRTFVPGSGWTAWAALGGNWSSAPVLNSQSDGIVNVFVRGPDCAVWQKYWNGSAWSDWLSLGGCISGAPTVVSRSAGMVDLFARGTDNALYQRHWDAAGWGAWTQVDADRLDSAPAAISDQDQRVVVLARRDNSMISKVWSASTGWEKLRDLGRVAVPDPPSAPPAPPSAPVGEGEVNLETGVHCTPAGGRLRVNVEVKKPKGKNKARVTKIVFFTKGKGRKVRVDRKAPFVVRIRINRPAGTTGRVYARVYYKRSARGKIHRKTVSRRYVVCR